SEAYIKKGYRFSYDMLGEGARTGADAERYFQAYADAIDYIGAHAKQDSDNPSGISVKLSALHPRYEYGTRAECVPALTEKLYALCEKAAAHNMTLTVDAEEVDRLEISLDIIGAILERDA